MPEIIDSHARIAKLRALGILDRYPDLAAVAASETAADAEIASIEAARAAEREAKRRAETPIDVRWAATPSSATDIALFCVARRPHAFTVQSIGGQLAIPALPSRSLGFIDASMRPTLPRSPDAGWSFGTVRQSVFLGDTLGSADAISVVARLTSAAVPLLLCIYRAVQHSQRPDARGLARIARSQLSQFGHLPDSGSYVAAGARAEHELDEAEASRIWAMATADAPANASTEIDRDAEQRRLAADQEGRRLDTMSARADRDATRSLFNEAAENAKFLAAVAAESAPR